jgi:cysteine desulfuration protein SufE
MSYSLRIEAINQEIEEIETLGGWEAVFQHLIETGEALPELPDRYRTDEHLVSGCQSRLWCGCAVDESGVIRLFVDSNSTLVKGLAGIYVRALDGLSLTEVDNLDIDLPLQIPFLSSHLSAGRKNGLASLNKQLSTFFHKP